MQLIITNFRYGCLLLVLSVMSWPALATDIQVRADRNPVSLNESFNLIYETSGSVDDDPDFSPLQQYLDILNQSQNSNISIINGNYTSKKSWRLTVMPRKTGDLTLPPINFGSDKSPGYKLKINKAADNPQEGADFFTRLKVDQQQVYVQQQLIVTQQLFSARNLSAYSLGELRFDDIDVVIEPLGEEKQYQTQIGEKAYLVVEKSLAVYPQKTGVLKLQPVLAEAQLKSSSSSFFGSLGSRGKVLRAQTNAKEVKVLSVPAQADMNPWLPAQDLQLVENWPSSNAKFVQGEPLTRTLSLKAEGLTAAQLPTMPSVEIEGLKQYPDQPLLNDIKNASGITGYRVEKIAFVPTRPGRLQLPAIEIPWWDITTQSRQVARIPARDINVLAAPGSQGQAVPQPPGKKVTQPLLNQQQKPSAVIDEPAAVGDLWKILTFMFAAVWIITLLAWYINSRARHATQPAQLSTQSSLKQAFKQLERACQETDAAACRNCLLTWARELYAEQQVNQLGDLSTLIPAVFWAEIEKLEASLYAPRHESVDFTLILEQARALMRQHKSAARANKDVLQPLYP